MDTTESGRRQVELKGESRKDASKRNGCLCPRGRVRFILQVDAHHSPAVAEAPRDLRPTPPHLMLSDRIVVPLATTGPRLGIQPVACHEQHDAVLTRHLSGVCPRPPQLMLPSSSLQHLSDQLPPGGERRLCEASRTSFSG